MAKFVPILRRQRLPEQRLFWLFEEGCLGALRRPEGISLYCWGFREDPSEPPAVIKVLLDEFAGLNLIEDPPR